MIYMILYLPDPPKSLTPPCQRDRFGYIHHCAHVGKPPETVILVRPVQDRCCSEGSRLRRKALSRSQREMSMGRLENELDFSSDEFAPNKNQVVDRIIPQFVIVRPFFSFTKPSLEKKEPLLKVIR